MYKLSEPRGRVEKENKFIELRSKGYTYSQIAQKLKLSKSIIADWNKKFAREIAKLKKVQLEELYNKYFMLKESRIEQLGETLKKINLELNNRDFSDLSTDKLLDFKMKYIASLKDEYIDQHDTEIDSLSNGKQILQEMFYVLIRLRNGEILKDQASREISIMVNILKTFEVSELEEKIKLIESAIKK
jgi:hypothetical protein